MKRTTTLLLLLALMSLILGSCSLAAMPEASPTPAASPDTAAPNPTPAGTPDLFAPAAPVSMAPGRGSN